MKKKSPITRNHIHPDDSGQLALDFMVGISIFMIAFVIVAVMTSGLLIGLQSREIDYDAVAYRTGTILVEDPGEIDEKVGESHIAPDRYAWDLLYPEYWNAYHESNVMRMGLLIPRYYYDTSPRVLTEHKISEFFNRTQYDRDPGYYKDKIIFGTYPYRFNVTLTRLDNSIPVSIGDEIPENSPTGYIRRVVLIKNSTSMDIMDLFYENESGDITVTYDFRKISEGNPAYMIYPSVEQTTINLTNFTGPDTYNLTKLTFRLNGNQIQPFITSPPTIWLKNYGDPLNPQRYPDDLGSVMNIPLNNSSYFEIDPAFFTSRNFPSLGPVDVLDVTMTIKASNSTNTTRIGGNYDYYYRDLLPGVTNFTQPDLIPAVIEVRVW